MRPIPHVNESDLARWKVVLNAVSPKVLAAIEAGALQRGRQIVLHIRNALNSAILAYASGDSDQFSSGLKESLDRFEWFFLPKFFSTIDRQYVYEICEDVLCAALILRDADAASLAQQILPYAEGQSDGRAKFVTALAALLTGRRKDAQEVAESLMASSTLSHGKALPSAIIAISQGDSSRFLAAIEDATIEFDRRAASEARGTPEAAIFFRGAALVRLYELVNPEKIPIHDLDVRLLPLND